MFYILNVHCVYLVVLFFIICVCGFLNVDVTWSCLLWVYMLLCFHFDYVCMLFSKCLYCCVYNVSPCLNCFCMMLSHCLICLFAFSLLDLVFISLSSCLLFLLCLLNFAMCCMWFARMYNVFMLFSLWLHCVSNVFLIIFHCVFKHVLHVCKVLMCCSPFYDVFILFSLVLFDPF